MARQTKQQRTSKPAGTKVGGYTLELGLPPEITKVSVGKLKALLKGKRGRLEDLFKADVIASTGMSPASPISCNDVRHAPKPSVRPPPKRRR